MDCLLDFYRMINQIFCFEFFVNQKVIMIDKC